jgi:pSer/pThr/pTyr-binding forkhead associated (FHA) protein
MQVLLRISNGKSNVRKVRIQADTIIGRSPECQLKVASSQISRRHCQILVRDTIVAIKDLGSANGTYVNGRQVPPQIEVPLTPGTRVMLGPLQFTVEYELPGIASATSGSDGSETSTVDDALVNADSAVEEIADVGGIPDMNEPDGSEPLLVPEQEDGIPDGNWQLASPAAIADQGQTAFMMNPFHNAELPLESFSQQPAVAPVQVPVQAAVVPPPVMVATPIAQPAIVQSSVPQPAVVLQVAQPVVVPPPSEDIEETDGEFNFGNFNAVGVDDEADAPNDLPSLEPTSAAASATPAAPKPAKKGFLQMLGWGKKKAAQPEAPAPQASIPETAAPAPIAAAPVAAAVSPTIEAPSFEMPVEEETVDDDDDAPDASLQNFFNNFK